MVNLLLVSAETSPDDPMPTRVSRIARILGRRGHRIFLLCNAGHATGSCVGSLFPDVIVREGVTWIFPPTFRLPSVSGFLKVMQSFWNAVSSCISAMVFLGLRGLRVDAVYSSTAQSQGLIATVLSAIWHVPLIVDYGDPSFARDAGLVRKIGLLLEKISLNRSDAVISSDPVISKYAYSICGKMPILLPNGYDQDLFPSTTCHSQPSSSDRFVTFVGKIDTSVYRLDVLLLASRRVIGAIPETRFRLIGSGPDIAKLRHLALELGVQRSIDLVGPIPHNEVASWICEAEVCVHMTNDTCLGMKVMEYMASGKPIVIAAPWWDKYDSVINSGLNCITVPLDPDALATAILRVMQDGSCAAYLGRNAQETASNCSWDEISETLIHVVSDLIRR